MRLLWYVLFVCMPIGCVAGVREELFWRAGSLYEQKMFVDALEMYQSLTPKSEAIWHNIGACYHELGHELQALICWFQAQKCATGVRYDELEKNIRASYQALSFTDGADAFYWRHLAERMLMRLPLLLLQCVFLAWLLFICICRFCARIQTMFGVFFAVLLGFLVFMKYSSEMTRYAVVAKEPAALYAGPGDQYQVVAELRAGSQCLVRQQEAAWVKVRAHGGYGWCLRENIVEITGN